MKDSKNEFVEMTRKALKEEDVHELVDLLIQREAARQRLLKHEQQNLTLEEACLCLEYEERVGERLHKEFTRLMSDMERLSRKTKAVKRYQASFPLPRMPAFVDHDA